VLVAGEWELCARARACAAGPETEPTQNHNCKESGTVSKTDDART